MPREDRRISFDNEEVYRALYSMCFQKQIKQPPAGNIVAIAEGPEHQLQVKIKNPMSGEETALEYSQDFVAAALMLFCRGSGIPLPKNAQKSVMISDGQLMLRVQK